MASNPLKTSAPAGTVTKGGKYQDLGYVGVGFEHKIKGPSGEFTVVNLSFDQGTDFNKLAEALASGKLLALRPRKEETRKVANLAYSIVLREKV